MKAKRLLRQLNSFFDSDEKTQLKEIKAIRKVLKALKEKEKSLKKELQANSDPENAASLQTKLDVIYAQRMKGLDQVKRLRAQKRGDPEAP
ncbi:MAG: hypothetical protein V2I82_10165 [Halieaceae bacterium]|jgi:hypothetical protein|nr:hypothetical protein [Halieaceae bacterium]